MKLLSTTILVLFTVSILSAQPELTLWITPDGYHHTHNHGTDAQYFCDSSYYIFYQPEPDSVFVTLKNEGDQPLEISQVATQSYAGAHFHVAFPETITLQTGEMHTLKVEYHLPSTYVNGINGQLDVTSNDPTKPNCYLYFDVGCLPFWNIYGDDNLGVEGSCHSPVYFMEYSDDVTNPNFVYDDSMNFFTYEEASDTSFPIMHMWYKGVKMRRQLEVFESFGAGKLTPNLSGTTFNLSVTDSEVQIYRDLVVQRNVEIDNDLTVQGTMQVNAITTPSDRRLKKDISSLDGVLNTMMLLRPTTYALKNAKPDDRQQYGFIAQELEQVLPELVHHDGEDQLSVNYMQIIPLLTAALQEQQKTIEELEERLSKLEGK